jgi:hypothetical protein
MMFLEKEVWTILRNIIKGRTGMKKRIISLFVIFFFAAGLTIHPSTGHTWEKGSIKVVPGVKFEERWDSNIFYDSNKEKSDWISIISPFIHGEAGFGTFDKHTAKVDYVVDLGMFAEYNDQNYGNHNLLGEVDFDLNDYGVKVWDNFLFTSSRGGTDLDTRNLRKENTLGTVWSADFNKLSFDVGYSNFILEYLSDTLKSLNRYDNSIWTTGYIRIQPKTQILVEYKYRNIQYPAASASGRNGNANSGMVGVKGDITSKVTGIAKGGYKYQDYKNGEHFSAPIAFVSLEYEATERMNLLFSYERNAFESSYIDNNFYAADHLIADIKYDLGHKFVAKGMGKYFRNTYDKRSAGESKKRTDNIFGLGCGLDYNLQKWVVCGVGYDYTQRCSTIDDREYNQHVFSANVRLAF